MRSRSSPQPDANYRDWDDGYNAGRWHYLAGIDEAPRYGAIADRIREQGPASVLDLGCGSGLLYVALGGPEFPGRYVGIDWAADALPRSPLPSQHLFVCGDVADLPLHGSFDVVVLSEVLYYLEDPSGVLARIVDCHLAAGGLFLISAYQPEPDRLPTWSRIVSAAEGTIAEMFHGTERRVIVGSDGIRSWALHAVQRSSEPL